jgi:glycerol-3-phosphate acyltransferase PlsY
VPVLLVAVAYAIGCISPGYLIVRRATGLDVRSASTGSTGARNAGRVAGRRVAATVFLLDTAKGAVAVGLAAVAGAGDTVEAACVLAVVAGHVLPAQLRFRGGRGLSPALGGMLVAVPVAALAGLASCALVAGATRRLVVAGIAGAVTGAAATWLLEPGWPAALVSATVVLICAAHARRPA